MMAGPSLQCRSHGCGRQVTNYKTAEQCNRCYRYAWSRGRSPCSIEDCDSPAPHRSGYCGRHHHRFKRYGDPLAGPGRGVPGKARGLRAMAGSYITSQGYVRIRTDRVGNDRWVLEHRWVMEKRLGRSLYRDETVHHKDLDRTNNALPHLELWTGSHPTGQRVEDVVAWCREMLARYDSVS